MRYTSTHHPDNTVRFTPAQIRRIAAEAGVEPRTAAKYLRGERVVSTCADRISRAIVTITQAAMKDAGR